MDNDLTTTDISLLVLLILFVGASFGATYSDNNWKHEMKHFSESSIAFRFDDSGIIYTIRDINTKNSVNQSSEFFKNLTISNP
jgi:hypothetical protein